MAAFLEKSTGSEGFHQVIDFLSQSHISYALTKKPEIYISFIKQFWRTAEASTDTDGEVTITAIIDGQSKAITEASLRRHLKLEDHDGITSIPNSEIFEQLALMGYQTDSDKLTFQKGVFSPQWSFGTIGSGRKAHLLEDKQIPSVGVFDEVFSTWMAFGGNTHDLGSFGEETDEITDLHQDSPRSIAYITWRRRRFAGIKRRRRDLSGDSVWILVTASQRSRLKVDLEPSTWRRRQKHKATPSR
ncbi:hypothetical protein Tco_0013998 [Tanacetum coccineum]